MYDSHPTPVLSRNMRTKTGTDGWTKPPRSRSATMLSEPVVEKMRGPKLVMLWAVLIVLSWAALIGLGYAAYRLVTALF